MGKWTLESVKGMISPMNQGRLFGHNVHAYYTLRYSPSMFGGFKEMPSLDWHEQILMQEHHKGKWWAFEANMYAHNPTSKTLEVWPKRYIIAYDQAAGRPFSGKGNCKLLDKTGRPVLVNALGPNLSSSKQKADAVRSYLHKNGGQLHIEIHDIPSINHPKGGEHKERLLRFNVGVEGSGLRLKMEQYLNVDGSKSASQWGRTSRLGWGHPWNPGGLSKSQAPAGVSMQRKPVLFSGEYL